MTNYEKLCEAVGIEHAYEICNNFKSCQSCQNVPCDNCVNNVKVYPSFTAEKQIEMIKLLMDIGCFTGYKYKTESNQYVLSFALKNYQNTDFTEALAGLALRLIEAGELEKDEIRRILE